MARLPLTEHTERDWRIHAIASDFRVEDVWSFRMPGAGPDDFHRAVRALQAGAGLEHLNLPSRLLFAVRWKLGELLGWDEQTSNPRARSLRDRLPDDLRELPEWVSADTAFPMSMVYLADDEAAEELINGTVHTVMHLGWVRGPGSDYELRMAALVKPNRLFGRAYMAAIAPFRHGVVYPSLTRTWERAWLLHGDPDRPVPRDTPVEAYVGVDRVPEELRRTFPGRADYADAFRMAVTDEAGAEEWARAMFGDEPTPGAYVVGTLLGERVVAGRSPERIGGGRIAARGPDWVRVQSPSWLMTGSTVIHAADGLLTLAVFQRYDKAGGAGRLVWGALSPVHRRLAAPTLRRARQALRERRADQVTLTASSS